MNFRLKSLLALMLAFVMAGPVLAVDNTANEALAKEKRCFSCHDLKADNHGPSFKDIARRFSGQKDAKAILSREIQAGTSVAGVARHWGTMKMPKDSDRAPVTQAEAEQLVDYILSIK